MKALHIVFDLRHFTQQSQRMTTTISRYLFMKNGYTMRNLVTSDHRFVQYHGLKASCLLFRRFNQTQKTIINKPPEQTQKNRNKNHEISSNIQSKSIGKDQRKPYEHHHHVLSHLLANSRQSNSDQVWIILTNFSFYNHRFDLELYLQDIKPIQIEPIISKNTLLPTGKYALLLPNSTIVNELKELIKQRKLQRNLLIKLINYQNIHLFPNRNDYQLASELKISNHTVLLSNLSNEIQQRHLLYWLEDFKVKDIRLINENNCYLVDFESYEEAMRFVYLKRDSVIAGKPVRLHHYTF